MDRFKLFRGSQLFRTREILTKFKAPSYTTTDRDAIKDPENGMIIYNTTTNKFQGYENSAWTNLI